MKKQLFCFVLLGLILLSGSFVSAIELNPFAEKKIYEPILKEDISNFLKEDFNRDYGVIRLSKTFFWFESDRIAEYSLIENTEICIINCEAKGKATLYKSGQLFEDIIFKTLKGKDAEIQSWELFIFGGLKDNYVDVPIYEKICKDIVSEKNTTYNNCIEQIVDYESENQPIEIWNAYNGETLSPGDYVWKLKGKKLQGQSVDFIPLSRGFQFEEWAVWSEGFNVGLNYYFSFNEKDAHDDITDYIKGNNITSVVNDSVVSGISGNARHCEQASACSGLSISNVDSSIAGANARTVNWWMNLSSAITVPSRSSQIVEWGRNGEPFGGKFGLTIYTNNTFAIEGHGNDWQTGIPPMDYYGWHMHTVTYDGSTVSWYIDGIFNASTGKTWNTAVSQLSMFNYMSPEAQNFIGELDEVGIWNRSLSQSEITDLWNGGVGLTYTSNPPTITLNLPENNTKYSESPKTINFNCSALDDIEVVNATLLINGIENYTQTGDSSDFTEIYQSLSFTDGNYNWSCSAYNNEDEQGTTETRYFSIDSTNPEVNVTYPYGNINYHTTGTNLTINWSVNDTHLGSCWWSMNNGVTNTSVACLNNNISINITSTNNNTFTIWVNDTFGNSNYNTSSWGYTIFETGRTFNDEAIELSQETFLLNITYTSSDWTSITGTLNYDSTNYTTTILGSGNNHAFTKTLSIPEVTSNQNKTFYWIIRLTDALGEYYYSTTTSNQTIINIGIDNCSSYSTTLYNLTLKDEQTQNLINGNIEIELTITGINGNDDEIDFSTSFTNVNNSAICMNTNLTSQNLYLDTTIKYSSTGYQTEYYNIQNYILNSSSKTQNITLYDLNTTSATIFDILYKGSDFIAVADAIVIVTKKYISEGIFKTVEIPKTDIDGKTTASLEKDSGIYTFNIYKNGEFLSTFSNVIPTCQNDLTGECQINLNAVSSPESVDDFTTLDNLNYQISWDETTKLIELTYSTSTGESSDINLFVQELNQYENDTICDNSVSASSGTLSCTVPNSYSNQTIIIKLYKDNNFISFYTISLEQNPFDYFGYTGYFLALIIIITIPLMFVTSLIGVIIGMIIGVVMLSLLFLSNGASIYSLTGGVMWFLIASAILLWKLNSSERR